MMFSDSMKGDFKMNKKIAVAYYSHSGNTRRLAQMIADKTGADIFEITPEKEYPADYDTVVEQAKKEIRADYRPALSSPSADLEAYDLIFAGTPNWWSTFAPPVAAYLEGNRLSGKKVIPFCTHGGGGFGHIEKDVQALCPDSVILPGFCAYEGSAADMQLSAWLEKIMSE